jgi:hypothetical protein
LILQAKLRWELGPWTNHHQMLRSNTGYLYFYLNFDED